MRRRGTAIGLSSANRGEEKRAEERKARERCRREDMALRRLGKEVRLAEAVEKAKKAEGGAIAAEARKRRLDAEARKEDERLAKARRVEQERDWAQHAAAAYFEGLRRYLLQSERRQALCRHAMQAVREPADRKRAVRSVPAPSFWTVEILELVDLTVDRIGDRRAAPGARIYCSRAFAWHLFGRRQQSDVPNPCPRNALRLLVDHSMPEYMSLVGRRYAVFDVLQDNHNVIDRAFMEMQWRYAELLGPVRHPQGLHHWPPHPAGAPGRGGAPAGSSSSA